MHTEALPDWRHCGYMLDEVCDVLQDAARSLDDEDVFDLSCYAYLKWSKTDKDDSNGETQGFISCVFDIWETLPETDKMFDWILDHCDGSILDYMEDCLLDYLMDHFKAEKYLKIKIEFFEQRIRRLEVCQDYPYTTEFEIGRARNCILMLMGELKYPIEDIRSYGGDKETLSKVELQYGNIPEAMTLYQELADKEMPHQSEYHIILKDLYRQYGTGEQYRKAMDDLMHRCAGNMDLLNEYKALFSRQEWPEVFDRLISSFSDQDIRVFPWLEAEGHYERLMRGIEMQDGGEFYLTPYEKTLKKMFPDRCLRVLVATADKKARETSNRNGYRSLAGTLRHITKYSGGAQTASGLANKYIGQYPRRPALREELEGFI